MFDSMYIRTYICIYVVHARVMPSAECHTDNRLVRCKPTFQFKPKPMLGYAPKKKLKVCSLQTVQIRVDFQENIGLCWKDPNGKPQ